MLNADRAEFDKHLSILCAGMDVPCTEERKEAYWKSLHSMPLVRFARAIEHVLEKESWTKIPKPAQIWEASKRARTEPFTPKDDGFRGDFWDEVANQNLLNHLTFRIKNQRPLPGKPASFDAMRLTDTERGKLGLDKHYLDASPEFIDAMGKLICAKNNWAIDMRDLAENGPVPLDVQRTIWHDYLREAEST